MVTQVNLSISLADVKFEYRNSKQTLMYGRSTTNDENGNTIASFCGSTAESIYYSFEFLISCFEFISNPIYNTLGYAQLVLPLITVSGILIELEVSGCSAILSANASKAFSGRPIFFARSLTK